MGHRDQLQDVRTFFMYLAAVVKDNIKKVSLNTLAAKGGLDENLHLFLGAQCTIVSNDDKKSEILCAFFASIFNTKSSCTQDTQLPELEVRGGDLSDTPIIQERMVSDLLCQIDTHKSMGLDGTHPTVMTEMVKEPTKPLSIIYQLS